jgi:hypothetical protein
MHHLSELLSPKHTPHDATTVPKWINDGRHMRAKIHSPVEPTIQATDRRHRVTLIPRNAGCRHYRGIYDRCAQAHNILTINPRKATQLHD